MKRTWRNWKVSLHRRRKSFFSRRNSSQPESAEGATDIYVRWFDCAGGTSRIWVTDPCINGRYEFFQGIFIGIEAWRGIAAVARRIEEIEYEPKGRCAPTVLGASPRSAGWAFLSCREIERKSSDRGRRGRLPPFQDENRQERQATGVAHPSSGLVDENRAIYPTAMPLRNNG